MKHQRTGFTLIELLLALMLTSLLTAALSMMIGQAARERQAMREQSHDPAWAGQLIDLLEQDLCQARWWAGADDRIVLIGLGRDGLPAQIEYRWVEHEEASALTRKEVSLTEGVVGRDRPTPSVMAMGLQGLTVGPYGLGERPASDERDSRSAPPIDRSLPTLLIDGRIVPLRSLPDQIALRLVLQDGANLGPSREVVLR